ncbi:MAG: 23S rRNA pseudouridine955/2504/2580 synthase [bacterium]|jgi:23S rRNA pseudouridine955/2504/2580 synthase
MTDDVKKTSEVTFLKINKLLEGSRLDKLLIEKYPLASFGTVQKLCRKGQIRIDGKRVKGNERVVVGQEVRIPPAFTVEGEEPQEKKKYVYHLSTQDKHDIENMTIFEDKEIIVINKPYGLPVQAGSGHSKSIDRMFEANTRKDEKPKLVHRIDKTTTGLLILAKTKDMATTLSNQFKNRKVKKTYWAIVKGRVRDLEGTIKTSMEKIEVEGKEKMATKGGYEKFAETSYKVMDSAGVYHWLEVYPKTGRKHQIRVHLESIGLPIVGDIKYGGARLKGDEQIPAGKLFLHARAINLEFAGGRNRYFKAEIPAHFEK